MSPTKDTAFTSAEGAAEIPETGVPKAWQITREQSARGKWNLGELPLENRFYLNQIYHCFCELPLSRDSLMALSELSGGLIACFLLALIYDHKNTQITKTMLLWETQA